MLHNLRQLLRYRGLIQSLVARELKARYRGSVLGFFWSFINPLLLLLIYTFVFTVVLPGTHPTEIEPYALFMFCGILPWTWFSSSLLESSNVADRRRQPDQEGAVPGGGAADRHRAGEHGALLPGPADPGGLPDLLPARRSTPSELLWFPVVVLVQLLLTHRPGADRRRR